CSSAAEASGAGLGASGEEMGFSMANISEAVGRLHLGGAKDQAVMGQSKKGHSFAAQFTHPPAP
ncbi:MAG TPA: hypothetical protein PK971_16720, partial [Saprospiraceae bacterium]|nr:hypothetical protein [Saprospiraceae bacterium]